MLLGAGNTWAVDWFYGATIKYTFNGGDEQNYDYWSSDNNSSQSLSLGTLTGVFKVTKMYIKVRDNWEVGNFYDGGGIRYNIGSGVETFSTITNTSAKGDWYDGVRAYELQNTNCDLTIASSTDASGNYTFTHWFFAHYSDGDHYVSNSSNNYKFTYTILPPAVSGFAVGHSDDDVIAGSGTKLDPYVIRYNGSLKLTATGSQAHSDANSSLQAKYGDDAYSTTTKTISDITSAGSVTVKGKYYNSTASLSGAESGEITVYYTIAHTVTITTAGWASLYLPFAAIVPENANVYYAKSSDKHDSYVTLTAISEGSTIPSGEGFIVKDGQYDGISSHSYNFVLSGSAAETVSDNILTGTASSIATPSGAYVLSGATTIDNCVFAPFSGANLAAYKAYIPAGSVSAPTLRFIIEEENNTTSIDAIDANEKAVKFLQNGQLFIKKNGIVYDITGRIVK